jgi:ferric-dicitrate binding protein FerR (iron transport regulator)
VPKDPPAPPPRGPTRALEALTDGTLDDVARADLERRAAADPELADAVEAYTPLDGLNLDRITDEALRRRGAPQRRVPLVPILIGALVGVAAVLAAWLARAAG